MKTWFSPSAGAAGPAEEPVRRLEGRDGPGRGTPTARQGAPAGPETSSVVAFLKIEKAPRLLASLASRVPPDIIPMPMQRLSGYCRGEQSGRVAFSGVVVCVPECTLAEEDVSILRDLGRMIPVFRVLDDPREVGLTFFERCREATPRIPRSVVRFGFGRPVIVSRAKDPDHKRLFLAENLSQGGLFINDPHLSCDPDDILQLRFPGFSEVPELLGRIRWVRTESGPGAVRGYGCAFDSAPDSALRRLVSGAHALIRERPGPQPPGPGRFPGRPGRR